VKALIVMITIAIFLNVSCLGLAIYTSHMAIRAERALIKVYCISQRLSSILEEQKLTRRKLETMKDAMLPFVKLLEKGELHAEENRNTL